MNSKGNMAIPELIAVIVVALLLVITAICFFGGPCIGPLERLKVLIPSFKFSTENLTESSIIGYNIGQDKPKYNDEVNWHEFPKETEYNKKKMSSGNARYYFAEGFFYNTGERTSEKSFEFKERKNNLNNKVYEKTYALYNFGPKTEGNVVILAYASGIPIFFQLTLDNKLLEKSGEGSKEIIGNTVVAREGRIFSIDKNIDKNKFSTEIIYHLNQIDRMKFDKPPLYVDVALERGYSLAIKKNEEALVIYQFYYNGKPLEIYYEIEKPTDRITALIPPEKNYALATQGAPEKEIISEVTKWRDSVFEKPMLLKFDSGEEEYFCVEKFPFTNPGNKFTWVLTIDLSKQVAQDSSCPA